jgi:hypothetical protein
LGQYVQDQTDWIETVTLRTVDSTIAAIKHVPTVQELPAPPYVGDADDSRPRIVLGVSSLRDCTSPEGHALIEGLRHAGWQVWGHGYADPFNLTDVREIIHRIEPGVVLVYDIREWGEHCGKNDLRDPMARFTNLSALLERANIFKVGMIRDAHNSVEQCNESFKQAGVHAWVHQYHPRIVKHLNNAVRPQHLIRSWHSVEPADVPPFDKHNREGCLLSGNLSGYYPLRQRLYDNLHLLPRTTMLGHPGYQRQKCHTPEMLDQFSRHKVAIVTSSIFGYAIRKFVEATAAGCAIITDLPTDEVIPFIDVNFTRVSTDVSISEVRNLLLEMYRLYNPERQRQLSDVCKCYYDWRNVGCRLDDSIEMMKEHYEAS